MKYILFAILSIICPVMYFVFLEPLRSWRRRLQVSSKALHFGKISDPLNLMTPHLFASLVVTMTLNAPNLLLSVLMTNYSQELVPFYIPMPAACLGAFLTFAIVLFDGRKSDSKTEVKNGKPFVT